MFKPLSLFIGLRYTAAKRKNNFISFISVVSIGGIALGIMTMIVVLSVMNGFQKEVRERSLAMAYDNKIVNLDGKGIADWQKLDDIALKNPNVIAGAPYNNGQGLLTANGVMRPLQIQGIDPQYESKVSGIADKITADFIQPADFNILKSGEFGIILGTDLALNLGVNVGDYVSLITPEVNVTAAGMIPRVKRMKVVGVFRLGMYEYDSSIGIMNINDAGKLFRVPEGNVLGIRLKLKDPLKARETGLEIVNAINEDDIVIFSWVDEFASLFKMIEIEKISMFVIMSLIIAVAVFNVVSTLVMVVTDKRPEIAILRTLGMSPKQIMAIFMVQGVIIGFFGVLIGIILGLLIAFNVNSIVKSIESFLGKTIFEPSVYPISEIPSIVMASDVSIISIIAFLLASLATLYPAWKAARTQPAEALRYD